MAKRRANRTGWVRQLPSGRWQARCRATDGIMHTAPTTYDTKLDATAWLGVQARAVAAGTWEPPVKIAVVAARTPTLAEYSDAWPAARDLKPRTLADYRGLLDRHILPRLGGERVDRITPVMVRRWYSSMDPDKATVRARSYGLLRTILGTAVTDDVIPANPCRIRGGGSVKRRGETKVATLEELAVIVAEMPGRYKALVLLAAWCGLRIGELSELRRKDIDVADGVIKVRRAVVRVTGLGYIVGEPKSRAGSRDVTVPPHVLPALETHMLDHVEPGDDALLFPSKHGGTLATPTAYAEYYRAREAAGRPDLRFHDLRHTQAVMAAQTGATLAELMSRLGHSTPAVAMRYQHASSDRDRRIADALSEMASATSNVVPLKRSRRG